MASQTAFTTAAYEDTSYGVQLWASYGSLDLIDVNAIIGSHSPSYYNVRHDCGFTIPTGQVIKGIEAVITRYRENSDVDNLPKTDRIRSVKGGSIGTTELKTSTSRWSSTAEEEIIGGPTDLLGSVWTRDDINDPSFGIAFAAYAETGTRGSGLLTTVEITVYYDVDDGLGTNTAAASLIVSNATLSANATFVPKSTATVLLVKTAAALSAAATFRTRSTSTTSLSVGVATLSAVATFIKPTYTAAVGLTKSNTTLSATATFAVHTYASSTALTTQAALLSVVVHVGLNGGLGGIGGTITRRLRPSIFDWLNGNIQGGGAPGATGGAGANNPDKAGSGGNGGGVMVLIAHTILNEGVISCNGGNGGNGE